MTHPATEQTDALPEILLRLLEKFAAADTCWVSSVRPDGRAHLAPIWHVWCDSRIYLVTPHGSVRARNISVNPRVSVALPDPMNVLIIEGAARPAPARAAQLQPLFQSKYDWDIATDADYDMIIEIVPRKVMAWGNHGEGRWHFDATGRLLLPADEGRA